MGCSSSKENDKTAAFARNSRGQTYGEQAEDAAAMLSGAGIFFKVLLNHSFNGQSSETIFEE